MLLPLSVTRSPTKESVPAGFWGLQGVEEPPLAVPSSRSLKNGTSFRSFRSKAQSVQSGDDAQSQQDLEEGEFSCRVDCWNGAYQETRAADAAVREGQDWIAHNQELLHQLQVWRCCCSLYCSVGFTSILHRQSWQQCICQRMSLHSLQDRHCSIPCLVHTRHAQSLCIRTSSTPEVI